MAFICDQILLRSSGFPKRLTNTLPLRIPFFLQYLSSFSLSSFTRYTCLFFPLQETSVFPLFTAATVIYFNSLIRIPGRSDGLHDECGLLPSHPVSLFDQLFVFCPTHFLFCGTEHLLLYLYRLHPALRFSHKVQKSIQGYQHAVCTARFVMLLQPCLVGDHFFLGNAPVFSHPLQEGTVSRRYLFNGGDAFFPIRRYPLYCFSVSSPISVIFASLLPSGSARVFLSTLWYTGWWIPILFPAITSLPADSLRMSSVQSKTTCTLLRVHRLFPVCFLSCCFIPGNGVGRSCSLFRPGIPLSHGS